MKYSLILLAALSLLHFTSNAQEQSDTTVIKPGDIEAARRIRRAELNDPIRPTWHLTIAEGTGMPFDPNGYIRMAFIICGIFTRPKPAIIGNIFQALICFIGDGIQMICSIIQVTLILVFLAAMLF
jgi:hypothetical protein